MSDWNTEQEGSTHGNTADDDSWNISDNVANRSANGDGFGSTGFDNAEGFADGLPGGDDKCSGCGETGQETDPLRRQHRLTLCIAAVPNAPAIYMGSKQLRACKC
ncbi:hypothetical protein FOXG_15942 [Fusarium oxysporum f. sp. lycopersici 4287]|uniref:Uncharacterized protein n=4 Tax=Fusarium oxysporum TaxID=5507 RepID=A0A0J9W722_FUSO4|nr:hypothetical protein FOXG_15942 [Fusarium oxysporum f. sp. lycopersici 4287]EXK26513.1 hypothetical protein FOMG_16917 [Fusarium oxysporum f. sp. melonis 26406]KNB18540.1 hypothetical protein FOXG_15942 [Fusarium oxysporum f. sp. lycopersici 4287]RKK66021.1 hypothetical protein BFJ69_g15780 [Fusarium oxysporum]